MSPRLLSLALVAKPDGLELEPHPFGEFFTLLVGDNGSGKTAVMCSLFWALGGRRKVEEPLWSKCLGVRLTMRAADGREAILFREFSDGLRATINIGGTVREFETGEAPYSEAILDLLGMHTRSLTAKGGGLAPLYMSVLLPSFGIDQDKGWAMPYAPFNAQNFIADQAEEVARALLDLDPRRDAERDRARARMTTEIERLDREVEILARAIESRTHDLRRTESRDIPTLRSARVKLESELGSFDAIVTAFMEADVGLRTRLEAAREELESVEAKLASAQRYRATLDRLTREAAGDLSVVGSNEVAAQAFRRFCGNSGCEFFQGHNGGVSYGRRVLYLKDQLKDVATAMKSATGQIAVLEQERNTTKLRLERLRKEYEALSKTSAASRITTAIDAVSSDLARVSTGLAVAEEIEVERAKRTAALAERQRIQKDQKDHDKAKKARAKKDGEMRVRVEAALGAWLRVLSTNDLGSVTVDDGFRVLINDKRLSDEHGPSGSQRTRLVLAYHGAMLQASLEGTGAHPGLLLFDAPKQHELDPAHFTAYLASMRELSRAHPDRIQIVISSRTDLPREKGDAVWVPVYPPQPGGKHPWFLGRPIPSK